MRMLFKSVNHNSELTGTAATLEPSPPSPPCRGQPHCAWQGQEHAGTSELHFSHRNTAHTHRTRLPFRNVLLCDRIGIEVLSPSHYRKGSRSSPSEERAHRQAMQLLIHSLSPKPKAHVLKSQESCPWIICRSTGRGKRRKPLPCQHPVLLTRSGLSGSSPSSHWTATFPRLSWTPREALPHPHT